MRKLDYHYNVGDVVNGSKIIEQIRIKKNSKSSIMLKAYIMKCEKCGYKYNTYEYSLKDNRKCPCCSGRVVVSGINDLYTTNNDLVKYLKNKEEAYIYTKGSNHKTKVKCPTCGAEKTIRIADLVLNGFSCPKCSDGISYPEKVVINILQQLNVNFITQLNKTKFDWCDNFKYDFYLEDYNCIIETHGCQHYIQKQGFGRELSEEHNNDVVKENLAIKNNINDYIVLDCRKSDLEFIKNNILKSKLSQILDLSNINWDDVEKFATGSMLKEVCDLWNKGIKSRDISKMTKLSRSTVCIYLNKGNKIGICKYDGMYEQKKGL